MAKGITAKQRAARKRNMAVARSAKKKRKGVVSRVKTSGKFVKSFSIGGEKVTSKRGGWDIKGKSGRSRDVGSFEKSKMGGRIRSALKRSGFEMSMHPTSAGKWFK